MVYGRKAGRGKIAGAFRCGWNVGGEPRSCEQAKCFIAAEDKSLVLHDSSADGSSKLVLSERRPLVFQAASELLSLIKKLVGIENLVAQLLICGAMPGVGARLRAQLDHASNELSPLRSQVALFDLELP